MATRWAIAPSSSRPRLETRAWLRTIGRAGPERWIWPVVAVSWAVLLWGAFGWQPLAGAPMSGHHHPGAAHPPEPGGPVAEAAGHLVMWMAMVGATMLPLIARNLRVSGLRSPRARRTPATLEVALGWALAWLAAGLVVSLGLVATASVPAAVTVGAVCVAAVLWRFTRMQRTALARCHRSFAPPLGDGATSGCLRFGASLGRDSLLACGAGMVLMAVAGHHLVVVVALGWLSWRDMRRPADSPGTVGGVLVLVGVGLFAILGQAWGGPAVY